MGESVIAQNELIRQFDPENFSHPAHENKNIEAIQQFCVQSIDANFGMAETHRIIVRLPFEAEQGIGGIGVSQIAQTHVPQAPEQRESERPAKLAQKNLWISKFGKSETLFPAFIGIVDHEPDILLRRAGVKFPPIGTPAGAQIKFLPGAIGGNLEVQIEAQTIGGADECNVAFEVERVTSRLPDHSFRLKILR